MVVLYHICLKLQYYFRFFYMKFSLKINVFCIILILYYAKFKKFHNNTKKEQLNIATLFLLKFHQENPFPLQIQTIQKRSNLQFSQKAPLFFQVPQQNLFAQKTLE